MSTTPVGQSLSGLGAALLDKKPEGRRVLNPGGVPAVHANDMRVEATAHEVILTFALVSGGREQVAQEVAKLVLSWPMVEIMMRSVSQLLAQSIDFRRGALSEQMEALEALAEFADAAVEGGAQPG